MSPKELPAFIRVIRGHIRNFGDPTVWVAAAVIALLLALGSDYYNTLRAVVFNSDQGEGYDVSSNSSELADTISTDGTVAASEIDSSDVLLQLLSSENAPQDPEQQAKQTADRAQEQAKANEANLNLFGLPDLNKPGDRSSTGNGNQGNQGNQATNAENSGNASASRQFGLLELLSGASNNQANAPQMGTSLFSAFNPGASADNSGNSANGVASSSALGRRTFSDRDSAFVAATQNGGMSVFQAGSSVANRAQVIANTEAGSNPSLTTAPGFTGYPYATSPVVNPNVPTYTGYPSSYAAPSAGYSAPVTSPTSYTGYPYSSGASYGGSSVPSSNVPNVGQGSAPAMPNSGYVNNSPNTAAQSGYPNGGAAPQVEVQNPPAPAYSVPGSTPGTYIGNGEINTFANP